VQAKLKALMKSHAAELVRSVGQHATLHVSCVGFAGPMEGFGVLKAMAAAVPRGQFCRSGLSMEALRTAFSSISSTISSTLTNAGSARGTLRNIKASNNKNFTSKDWEYSEDVKPWAVALNQHQSASFTPAKWPPAIHPQATGVILRPGFHGVGAERFAFLMAVVERSSGGFKVGFGGKLVAKESKYEENLDKAWKYHKPFFETQLKAQARAKAFNAELRSRLASIKWNSKVPLPLITFLEPELWRINKKYYLVEQFLEGDYRKWNSNGGWKRETTLTTERPAREDKSARAKPRAENTERESRSPFAALIPPSDRLVRQVTQCFTHYTYVGSGGKEMVCDLQGVFDVGSATLRLTDPVCVLPEL
jgi:hypothetical protein